jgi:hypothetical protein
MKPQNSSTHMEMMRQARHRTIQTTTTVGTQTIESEKKNVDSPSPPRPKVTQLDSLHFAMEFGGLLPKILTARWKRDVTMKRLAISLSSCGEWDPPRQVVPMPNRNHIDPYWKNISSIAAWVCPLNQALSMVQVTAPGIPGRTFSLAQEEYHWCGEREQFNVFGLAKWPTKLL